MAWFAQNNAFGGVNVVQAEAAPVGYRELSDAQMAALMAAGPGATIDAGGEAIAPAAVAALEAARALQIQTFYRQTRGAIQNGFGSSALGSSSTYASTPTDQANLCAAVLASASVPIWCAAAGVWSLTTHTAAQALQVMKDWTTFRAAQSQALATAVAAVNAAGSVQAVQAVTLT